MLAIAGCGGCGPNPLSAASSPGATLKTSATEAVAGAVIALDATGSRIESLVEGCPMNLSIYDETTMDEVGSRYDETPEKLQTVGAGKDCRIVNGRFDVALPKGKPGSSQERKYTALVEAFDEDGNATSSKASVVVEVTTLATGATTPPGGGTPPAPAGGTPPSGPPADGCAVAVSTGAGSPPVLRTTLNPAPLVVGKDTFVSAFETTDADGDDTVDRFRFDYDGNGTWDYTNTVPVAKLTPDNTDPQTICVEAHDTSGNTSVQAFPTEVKPAGYLYNDGYLSAQPGQTAGTQGMLFVEGPDAATSLVVDFGDGSAKVTLPWSADADLAALQHTWATAGTYLTTMAAVRGDERSTVSEYVRVEPLAAGRADVASAAAKKKPKAYTVPFDLRPSGAKLVDRGKVAFGGGVLSAKGALVTTEVKAKLPKALRKATGLKGLKALTGAQAVARFGGSRVLLTPDTWGIAGRGLIVAQSRKSKRTRVCIGLASDGRSTQGTRWTILGATGKAKGLTGGGTMTPMRLGPDQPPLAQPVAIVAAGRAKRIGACKALVKRLGKGKK